jgi:hypothetical protein
MNLYSNEIIRSYFVITLFRSLKKSGVDFETASAFEMVTGELHKVAAMAALIAMR